MTDPILTKQQVSAWKQNPITLFIFEKVQEITDGLVVELLGSYDNNSDNELNIDFVMGKVSCLKSLKPLVKEIFDDFFEDDEVKHDG